MNPDHPPQTELEDRFQIGARPSLVLESAEDEPAANPWRPVTYALYALATAAWCCTPAVVVAAWKWGWTR